jgi:hypothetical protein
MVNALKHIVGYSGINKYGYQLNTVRGNKHLMQQNMKKEKLQEKLRNKRQNKK